MSDQSRTRCRASVGVYLYGFKVMEYYFEERMSTAFSVEGVTTLSLAENTSKTSLAKDWKAALLAL